MKQEDLGRFVGYWLPQLEEELRAILHSPEEAVAGHYGMMHYHMGWVDEHFQPYAAPAGKRLRPILCLLACAEVGGDPSQALPAAAGIEILHNFSLIHDDVEDGDETRRHRPTVWKLWGIPQAINVGDAMFALAFAGVQRLSRRGVPAGQVLAALDLFTQTCLALTEGQHLDIDFEQREQVTVADYLRMIQGKTAALIRASVQIGALLGGASPAQQEALGRFGQALGLAFQIQDDILGIWGDPAVTGKAAGNDILRRKKSLPLLHGLNSPAVGAQLQALFAEAPTEEQVPIAMELLAQAGSRAYAVEQVAHHHEQARQALEEGLGRSVQGSVLWQLAETLLHRDA